MKYTNKVSSVALVCALVLSTTATAASKAPKASRTATQKVAKVLAGAGNATVKAAVSTKKFAARHRVALGLLATAVAIVVASKYKAELTAKMYPWMTLGETANGYVGTAATHIANGYDTTAGWTKDCGNFVHAWTVTPAMDYVVNPASAKVTAASTWIADKLPVSRAAYDEALNTCSASDAADIEAVVAAAVAKATAACPVPVVCPAAA